MSPMDRWRARRAERDEPESLLRDAFQFDTRDPVDEAFEDYQTSVADILDADPIRRDDLVRDLEAATAEWERMKFTVVTRPLRRDLRFRLAMYRASKTKPTT